GEPATTPARRTMMADALNELAEANGAPPPDLTVTLAIPGGERLAEKTMNQRLGIVGGLSVLGTTGIVVPYSCSSWIHAIQRGIDVARAAGLEHIAAATGTTSERAVQRLYELPEAALIDMGDFVGGTLKYLRRHCPAGARGGARDLERRERGRGRDRRPQRRFSGAGRGRGMSARHLLILGGTGEAAALARGAQARFGESMIVTTALAGRTRH